MIIRGMETGPMQVNTYLLVDEETRKGAIIDPGGFDQKTIDYIEEFKAEIEYIILTHGHVDHTGGIPKYKELFPNVKLVCSEAEKVILADGDYNLSSMLFGFPVVHEPDITVNEGEKLAIGESEVEFMMTPGHTIGGMCIICDGAIFTGDTLFRESVGRTDFASGSYDQIIASIKEKIMKFPDSTDIMPGHMDATTIEHEKENNPFVQD